jgi:transposase
MDQSISATAGIDISKDQLDAYLHPDNLSCQFSNNSRGHRALIAWLRPAAPQRVVYEATGPSHRALEEALDKAGVAIVRINPRRARRFAEALGSVAKTDAQDAILLARFGAMLHPKITKLASPPCQILAELVGARRHLIKQHTATRNRRKTANMKLLKQQADATLRLVTRQIEAID